jgi:CelD/BcsL family acetyltransferase involved in cellulose biosynthesis
MIAAEQTAPEGAIAVEELTDRAAIGALFGEWERLRAEVAARGGTRGPFLSPTWISIFAASLAGAESGRALRILVAHRQGRLAGILPLVAERRQIAGLPARVLRSLSDDHSDRFDALLDGEAAARAIFDHLARDRSWDLLELREAPVATGAGIDLLIDIARARGQLLGEWPSLASPYLPLPSSVAELERGLAAKFRANLRRRARKLAAEVGPLALERLRPDADSATIDRALDDGFGLEAAGWKGEAGTAIACDPALSARYRALAHAFAARGQLALSFLTVAGARRAFHFALIEDGVYYLLKPGYDPALASYGPGHLHLDLVARALIEDGAREIDLLGDDLPWKRDWTDRVRRHAWRYIVRPTPFGRALHAWKFRLAPVVKRLGQKLTQSLSRSE